MRSFTRASGYPDATEFVKDGRNMGPVSFFWIFGPFGREPNRHHLARAPPLPCSRPVGTKEMKSEAADKRAVVEMRLSAAKNSILKRHYGISSPVKCQCRQADISTLRPAPDMPQMSACKCRTRIKNLVWKGAQPRSQSVLIEMTNEERLSRVFGDRQTQLKSSVEKPHRKACWFCI